MHRWGHALDRLLGKSKSEVAAKKPSQVKDDEVWVTLVVVALLEATVREKKELWELVAEKAMKFVEKNTGKEFAEELRERAKEFVEEVLNEKKLLI